MATHDISRDQWPDFFEGLAQTHTGIPVTVETVDPQHDPQIDRHARPLAAISYDPTHGDAGAIHIQLGTENGKTLTILGPKHVYRKTGAGLISDEVNPDEVIEITAGSHPAITQLQFHPPAAKGSV